MYNPTLKGYSLLNYLIDKYINYKQIGFNEENEDCIQRFAEQNDMSINQSAYLHIIGILATVSRKERAPFFKKMEDKQIVKAMKKELRNRVWYYALKELE